MTKIKFECYIIYSRSVLQKTYGTGVGKPRLTYGSEAIFISWRRRILEKDFKTIQEQIEILKSRDLIILDNNKAK